MLRKYFVSGYNFGKLWLCLAPSKSHCASEEVSRIPGSGDGPVEQEVEDGEGHHGEDPHHWVGGGGVGGGVKWLGNSPNSPSPDRVIILRTDKEWSL